MANQDRICGHTDPSHQKNLSFLVTPGVDGSFIVTVRTIQCVTTCRKVFELNAATGLYEAADGEVLYAPNQTVDEGVRTLVRSGVLHTLR